MSDLLKVHHLDSKGKLVRTTPRRIIQRKGFPDLVIKLEVNNINKFVDLSGKPYDVSLLPDEVKAEYAYLLPQKEEPIPVPSLKSKEIITPEIEDSEISEKEE